MRGLIVVGVAAALSFASWQPAVAQDAFAKVNQEASSKVLTTDQIEAADPEQLQIVGSTARQIDFDLRFAGQYADDGDCDLYEVTLDLVERNYVLPGTLEKLSLRRSQKEALRAYALKKLIEARKIQCPPKDGETQVASAAGTPVDVEDGGGPKPVEYVRICDAFGEGFYYIPGTETCLRVGGGPAFSRIDTASIFGTGTVVDTGEHFVAETPDSINRLGFNLGGGLRLPGAGIIPDSGRFLIGNFAYAGGSRSSSGDATVGEGGVTTIGQTFLYPDGVLGTGVSTSTADNFIEGTTEVSNSWGVGSFGYGESFQPSGPLGPTVSVGALVSAEVLRQDFSAESRISDPTPLTLLSSQATSAEMIDRYFGLRFQGDVSFPVTDGLTLGVGGYLTPTIHSYYAVGRQFTSFGSLAQSLDASGTDVDVIAGVNANLLWQIRENVRVGVRAEWSSLPITAVNVPPNPDAQPGGFDQEDAERWFMEIIFQTEW